MVGRHIWSARSTVIVVVVFAAPWAAASSSNCNSSPGAPGSGQLSAWHNFNIQGAERPPHPRLVKTLELISTPGRALDLGAGGGRDSRELLKRGWVVDAVDSSPTSTELLQKLQKEFPGRLHVIASKFEALVLKSRAYDLISGSYSLPFCQPKVFVSFWSQLKRALRPGGLISVDLFGTHDTWNIVGKDMTFVSRVQVEDLTRGLKVLTLAEEEYDGETFSGQQKHWHLFSLIARRD